MQANKKKRTERKAQEAMLPFLEEKLVRAETIGSYDTRWGIIVPLKLVKIYCESSAEVYVENRAWAIWKNSRQEAINAYESATETELRPHPLGLLSYVDVRKWQLELIDEEAW